MDSSSLWGCRCNTFVTSGLWDVSALLLSSISSCHMNVPDMFLNQGALQLQAVALAVTSRTMVNVGYVSCSCTMLKYALLLDTSDVNVCAGEINLLAGVPRVCIIKKDVGSHPNAHTPNTAESHP